MRTDVHVSSGVGEPRVAAQALANDVSATCFAGRAPRVTSEGPCDELCAGRCRRCGGEIVGRCNQPVASAGARIGVVAVGEARLKMMASASCGLNAGLDADFRTEAFEHVAFFDEANSWIEMRLRANGAQIVRIDGVDLELTSPTTRRSAPRSARSSRATP